MDSPDLDQVVPWEVLRAATCALAAVEGTWIRVGRLPRVTGGWAWGMATGRHRIDYATEAPLDTVAHEVAHCLRPDDEHEQPWADEYARLRDVLRSLPFPFAKLTLPD